MGKVRWLKGLRPGRIAVAFVLLWGGCISANAFEIPTGNENIELRWDNTLRYNLGYRIGTQDKAVIANTNLDDGNRNFKSGFVTNRLDILSEFDVSYRKSYGIRVSGAGWYDQVYKNNLDNDSIATSNHFDGNGNQALGFSDYAKKHYAGPDGELLDAFAFGNFNIADIPLQIKAGRHTLYFGESLGLTAALNGICYAQSPLDIAKGYAVPGVSVKELFRPLNSVSATVHPIQHTFDYRAILLTVGIPSLSGSRHVCGHLRLYACRERKCTWIRCLGRLSRGDDITPKNAKDWGVAMRWSPEVLDGTLGLFYRKFSDKFPQLHVNMDPLMLGSNARYQPGLCIGNRSLRHKPVQANHGHQRWSRALLPHEHAAGE